MQAQQAGLELVLPGLFLLCIVLFGWFANFYLFYHFVMSFRNKTPRSYWSIAWGVGWFLLILGGIVRLAAPSGFDPATSQAKFALLSVGTLLWMIGCGAWIYGFFQFRRSREAHAPAPLENTDRQDGDWPPPPKPPA